MTVVTGKAAMSAVGHEPVQSSGCTPHWRSTTELARRFAEWHGWRIATATDSGMILEADGAPIAYSIEDLACALQDGGVIAGRPGTGAPAWGIDWSRLGEDYRSSVRSILAAARIRDFLDHELRHPRGSRKE